MAATGARGAYTKVKQVGKGSFGAVFLVKHTKSGEQLIMKEVSLRGLPAKERQSTLNEVNVLKRVVHPNAIGYRDSFNDRDTLCIVMEYASGGDLSGLIANRKRAQKRFSEEEILRMSYQLISALAYCHHDLHMLHRDLKPQNVFVAADGSLKLGDFGLSKMLAASQALAMTQCGTPLYMSPELCAGQSYNRAADVWAIGCILYEMMSLSPPWVSQLGNAANNGITGLLRVIRSSTLDLNPLRGKYSADLINLLASLLHKSASARPALNVVLNASILKRFAPEPTPSRPSTAVTNGESRDANAVEARGVEEHAAAEALQRSFRRRGLAPVPEEGESGKANARKLGAKPSAPARPAAERPATGDRPSLFNKGRQPEGRPGSRAPSVFGGPTADAAQRLQYQQKQQQMQGVLAGLPCPCRVKLTGINSRPELNGQSGVAQAFDKDSGRYDVLLDGAKEVLSVRALNVLPADSATAKPPARGVANPTPTPSTQAPSTAGAAPAGLLVSRRIKLADITSRPELNGRCGTAQSFDRESGRYDVLLDGARDVMKVRASNVQPADSRPAPSVMGAGENRDTPGPRDTPGSCAHAPSSAAPSASDGAGALVGRRVKLTGINSRPELNGQVGIAKAYEKETGRYDVMLDGAKEVLSVRASNVLPVYGGGGGGGGGCRPNPPPSRGGAAAPESARPRTGGLANMGGMGAKGAAQPRPVPQCGARR